MVATVQSTTEARTKTLPTYDQPQIQETSIRLNEGILRTQGIVQYKNLKDFNSSGVKVEKFETKSPKLLDTLRYGKRLATTGAVALNLWSVGSLFQAAYKLLASSFGHGDEDDAYSALGKAYSKSSIAGGLTGIANESSYWSIGSLGMGLFSWLGLDKLEWLGAFSISDGLASIGMGQVRCRDEQNTFAVQHSIFNNKILSPLKSLMPVEQAIQSFVKRFKSQDGWNRFSTDEPYSLFSTAGGGLIGAGGILTVASLFKNKLADSVKSFAYIPYSLFSLVNLIALYRDGQMVNKRSDEFGGRKLAETYSMKAEGYCKQIAAPVLGFNNFLLGLKGAGIDQSGVLYNIAMATRACGAAFAFLGFTAQSALKFFKTDLFGPKVKQFVKIFLDPQEAKDSIFKLTQAHRPRLHDSNKFDPILENDTYKEIFNLIIHDPEFEELKNKSQAGLPSPLAPTRAQLQRHTHSKRVAAIGIIMFDALLKNTTDPETKKFLTENEEAFKVACLLHDIGHIGRSHLAEKAIKGHNNDELTMDILKGRHLKIAKKLQHYYTEKHGEAFANKMLEKIQEIIGHKNPLSKLLKTADFTEYVRSRGGDFNTADHVRFPEWSIEKMQDYAQTIKLYKDEKGKLKLAYSWDGAKETFNILFDRLRFNAMFNSDPIITARELAYILGVDAADISVEEARTMAENKLDNAAKVGIEKLNGQKFSFTIKVTFGGEAAYCGYGSPRNRIMVLENDMSEPVEFLEYLESVAKHNDTKEYNELTPKVNALTTPQEIELEIEVEVKNNKKIAVRQLRKSA